MTDNEKQFENFARKVKFDDKPDYRRRDRLEERLLSTFGRPSHRAHPGLRTWRSVTDSRMKRLLVAAAIVVGLFIGIGQFGAAQAVFAKATGTARTGLARLKQYLARLPSEEFPALPPAKSTDTRSPADRNIQDGPTLAVQIEVFAPEGKSRKKLARFFDSHAVQFTRAESDPNLVHPTPSFWATLSEDKTEAFLELAKSSQEVRRIASPHLVVKNGTEAILYVGTITPASVEGLAVAVVPTVRDDEGRIDLDFSFIFAKHSYRGFEIPNVQMHPDKTLLVQTAIPAARSRSLLARLLRSREETILILLRLQVMPPEELLKEKTEPASKQ